MLYRATLLGDGVRKLLDRVHSPITFSSTGRQFAFIRQDKAAGEEALMVADENGAEEKKLAARKPPEVFRLEGPAWSPDGKLIACGVLNTAGGTHQSVVGVRTADDAEQPLTTRRWERVEQVAWLASGSGLMMVAAEPRTSVGQLWYLAYPPYPDAEVRRVAHDLSNYTSFSLTADSGKLAAVRSDRFVNLWIAPGNDAATARQTPRSRPMAAPSSGRRAEPVSAISGGWIRTAATSGN